MRSPPSCSGFCSCSISLFAPGGGAPDRGVHRGERLHGRAGGGADVDRHSGAHKRAGGHALRHDRPADRPEQGVAVSETVAGEPTTQAIQPRQRRWATLWRRFKRNKLAVVGLVIVVIMVLTAVFAPLIAPSDPQAQDYALTLRPPGEGGLMGTDSLGSDVFSRVVYGARISLQASLISVGIAMGVGVPLGLISGYFR